MKSSASETVFPPGYVALVERFVDLIPEWCAAQSSLPDLKWLDWGPRVFVGLLHGSHLDYLCDSPDARRLCEWLDEKTERKGSLFQMVAALEILGHLPKRGTP